MPFYGCHLCGILYQSKDRESFMQQLMSDLEHYAYSIAVLDRAYELDIQDEVKRILKNAQTAKQLL